MEGIFEIVGAIIILVAVAVTAFIIIGGTVSKSRWGINFKTPDACPTCAAAIPKGPRIPVDAEEALWGGWTCKACGQKLDKWGRARAAEPPRS